jgi:ferric-dicitrate binding protein FerR (iron transport regulator)
MESAGYVLHVVQGGSASPAQAAALTEWLREADLHVEVWSLTMRLPDAPEHLPSEDGAVPLVAGLVIADPAGNIRSAAERAAAKLAAASRELGLVLYAPSLLQAAGDEVGAARHRRALRQLIST